jgi:predicted  nucleic acid-binding Zn-ribbon protein
LKIQCEECGTIYETSEFEACPGCGDEGNNLENLEEDQVMNDHFLGDETPLDEETEQTFDEEFESDFVDEDPE